jgi:hypothetical protein
MAGDIIEYSNVDTADIDLLKAIRRYNAWLKVLDHKASTILESNMQKELIVEVLFIKEKILSGISPSIAWSGWVGHEDEDQDFVYSDC